VGTIALNGMVGQTSTLEITARHHLKLLVVIFMESINILKKYPHHMYIIMHAHHIQKPQKNVCTAPIMSSWMNEFIPGRTQFQ
jgi:hypothetical protein